MAILPIQHDPLSIPFLNLDFANINRGNVGWWVVWRVVLICLFVFCRSLQINLIHIGLDAGNKDGIYRFHSLSQFQSIPPPGTSFFLLSRTYSREELSPIHEISIETTLQSSVRFFCLSLSTISNRIMGIVIVPNNLLVLWNQNELFRLFSLSCMNCSKHFHKALVNLSRLLNYYFFEQYDHGKNSVTLLINVSACQVKAWRR